MSEVRIVNEVVSGKHVTHITQKMLDKHERLKRQVKESASMLLASLKLGATVEITDAEAELVAYRDIGSERKPKWRAGLVKATSEAHAKAFSKATEPTPYDRLKVEAKTAKNLELVNASAPQKID